jgi:hypothetical protein
MDFDFQEDGRLRGASLSGFWIVNELGMACICKLSYSDNGDPGHSVQLRLSAEQCRAIGEQLLYQAAVIECERPTAPQ